MNTKKIVTIRYQLTGKRHFNGMSSCQHTPSYKKKRSTTLVKFRRDFKNDLTKRVVLLELNELNEKKQAKELISAADQSKQQR